MENLQVDRLPNDIISRRDGGGKGDGEPVVGGGSGRIEWWSRRLRGKRDRGCAVEGFATQSRPEGTISNGTKHESAGTVDRSESAIFQLLPQYDIRQFRPICRAP